MIYLEISKEDSEFLWTWFQVLLISFQQSNVWGFKKKKNISMTGSFFCSVKGGAGKFYEVCMRHEAMQ